MPELRRISNILEDHLYEGFRPLAQFKGLWVKAFIHYYVKTIRNSIHGRSDCWFIVNVLHNPKSPYAGLISIEFMNRIYAHWYANGGADYISREIERKQVEEDWSDWL